MEYLDSRWGRPIYNLQSFLRTISRQNEKVYPVIPDGIFGEDTKRSVESFQSAHGMEVTGEVNSETWEKIVNEYKICEKFFSPVRGIKIITNDKIIKRGQKAPAVYIIQSMIVSLSDKIENINEVAINGIYDDDLYAEVKNLKPIFNQTGEDIDKEFINILAILFEHAVIFKPDYYTGNARLQSESQMQNAAAGQPKENENDNKNKDDGQNNVIVWKFF